MVFEIVLPIPENTLQLILVIIGFTIGDWFSAIDYIYQQSEGFKKIKSDIDKKLAKAFFDAFHHWQIGALMFFFHTVTFRIPGTDFIFSTAAYSEIIRWIGVGIWGHDWKDWQHVLDRYKKAITGEVEDPEKPPEE